MLLTTNLVSKISPCLLFSNIVLSTQKLSKSFIISSVKKVLRVYDLHKTKKIIEFMIYQSMALSSFYLQLFFFHLENTNKIKFGILFHEISFKAQYQLNLSIS